MGLRVPAARLAVLWLLAEAAIRCQVVHLTRSRWRARVRVTMGLRFRWFGRRVCWWRAVRRCLPTFSEVDVFVSCLMSVGDVMAFANRFVYSYVISWFDIRGVSGACNLQSNSCIRKLWHVDVGYALLLVTEASLWYCFNSRSILNVFKCIVL
jgi:hypothetical protein